MCTCMRVRMQDICVFVSIYEKNPVCASGFVAHLRFGCLKYQKKNIKRVCVQVFAEGHLLG